jgi:DGQHR domain-containing protein
MFGTQLEAQVRSIIGKAGFKTPSSKDHTSRIRKAIPGNHQIDVLGWDEEFLLAVECTGKQELGSKSLKTRISEVADELRDIRKWWREYHGPKAAVRMVLATRNIKITERIRHRAERKGISVWDDYILDQYKKTVRALGVWTRYEIMWSLDFRRELGTDPIKINGAVEMRQKKDRIYIFPISPEKLLRIAFVFRRDPSYAEGYQRIIQAKKLQEIRRYLVKEEGLVPNSIIVNLARSAKFKAYPGYSVGGTRVGDLLIPPIPCSAWVIDGQHRLMAFSSKPMRRLARKFSLCAVGFRGLRRDRQARLFLKINETQKRVNAGLRADLASDLYPYEPRGAAALVVKELSIKSPFKGVIATRPWERNKLKLANFADSLLRSGLISATDKRISRSQRHKVTKTVRQFFLIADRRIQNNDVRDFVFGNNGVSVLLRILQRSLSCGGGRLTSRNLESITDPIKAFPWRQVLREGVYSSEGDRLRLAERIMKRIAKKCRWFSLPPRAGRRRR